MNAPRTSLVGLLVLLLAAPSAPATKGVEARRILLKKGGHAFRAKQFLEAARYWHRACKIGPSAELWYRVGVALYKAEDVVKARSALHQALTLDPEHAKAARALRRLEPAEPTPPTDDGDDGDGGTSDPPPLDRLEAVTVEVDDARAEQAWTDAHRFRKLGEYDRAVARFVEAYRFGYARAEVDFYLGQALLEDELLDPALVHLRRAREAVPLDQGICLLLGKAHALRGDSSEQIEALETAVRLDPGYGEAHFQLALALDLVGDSEGVLEHSQKAIRIDPSYRDGLQEALRDGAVVGRLRDLLKATLDPDPEVPPPSQEELDGYATRLAKLLYPGALPELADEQRSMKKGAIREELRPEARLSRSSAVGMGGAGEDDLGETLGDTFASEPGAAAQSPAPQSPPPEPQKADGPVLAGVQFSLVRDILEGLHQGEGRRAFERVPHGDRARFKRDFLAAIRGRDGLADLRVRVEAALREG